MSSNKKVNSIQPQINFWAQKNQAEIFVPELTPPLFTREECLANPNHVIEIRDKWTNDYFRYLETLRGYTHDKPCGRIEVKTTQNELALFDPYGQPLNDVLPNIRILNKPDFGQGKEAHILENENNYHQFLKMAPGIERLTFAHDQILIPRLEMESRAWDYARPIFDFWALPESEVGYKQRMALGSYFNYVQPAAIVSEVEEARIAGVPIDYSHQMTIFTDSQLDTQSVSVGNIVQTFTSTYEKLGITSLSEALSLVGS
jgi:hypothetical protein